MKHLFVPYYICVLAKNKGFKEKVFSKYDTNTDDLFLSITNIDYNVDEDFIEEGELENFNSGKSSYISAPLYQQLIDWFREKHNIHIYTGHIGHTNSWSAAVEETNRAGGTFWTRHYDDYYEAVNQALEEAFKLI